MRCGRMEMNNMFKTTFEHKYKVGTPVRVRSSYMTHLITAVLFDSAGGVAYALGTRNSGKNLFVDRDRIVEEWEIEDDHDIIERNKQQLNKKTKLDMLYNRCACCKTSIEPLAQYYVWETKMFCSEKCIKSWLHEDFLQQYKCDTVRGEIENE